MKIIKEGKLPGEQLHYAKCKNCKTEFEFQEKEANRGSDPRGGMYYSIACPLKGCGVTVFTYN